MLVELHIKQTAEKAALRQARLRERELSSWATQAQIQDKVIDRCSDDPAYSLGKEQISGK